jgi:uncharacterized damage-inducible protein DinB
MQIFEELMEAWQYTRDGVIAEVENLPEARFSECPPGLMRSALDLVNHIVESGRLMSGELSLADGDFQRKSYPALIAEHARAGDMARSKKEAVELLRRSHAEGDAMLHSAGAERLMQPIRQFNGVPATRLAWMSHGISHEEYHRGQIAIYARLLGEKPALTKLIEGE